MKIINIQIIRKIITNLYNKDANKKGKWLTF